MGPVMVMGMEQWPQWLAATMAMAVLATATPMLRPEDAGRTLNPVHLHRLTGGSGGLSAELKPTSVVSVSEAKLPKRHNSILDYYTDDTERNRVSHSAGDSVIVAH